MLKMFLLGKSFYKLLLQSKSLGEDYVCFLLKMLLKTFDKSISYMVDL